MKRGQGPCDVQISFTADRAGTYVAQLIVNDGQIDSDPATTTVTTLNTKPEANAGSGQTVFVGGTVTLDGSRSTDVGGDPLVKTWGRPLDFIFAPVCPFKGQRDIIPFALFNTVHLRCDFFTQKQE
jgi:hypothetical protein